MAASTGLAVRAISGLARISRCQGLTPSVLQPARSSARASRIAGRVKLGVAIRRPPASTGQNQRAHLLRERVTILQQESFVARSNMPLSIEYESSGHDAHTKLLRQFAVRVIHHAKPSRVARKE